MSHVAKLAIQIKDLSALKEACKACGLQWKEGQKTHKWYGRWVNDYHGANAAYKQGIDPKNYGKCDHAIGVPGNSQAYEIGVVKMPDGTYSLIWDFWGGGHGLQALAGDNCSNLVKSYVTNVTKKKLAAQGYTCQTVQNKDGVVKLEFVKY